MSFGGQIITGDGDDHVSVTDITTDNTSSGLSCIFTSRVSAYGLRWYLNEVKLPNQAGESWQSYFGWSCLLTIFNGYPVSTLKRDAATDAIEGIFTCQKVIGNNRYSSVPIGVYYPSKFLKSALVFSIMKIVSGNGGGESYFNLCLDAPIE